MSHHKVAYEGADKKGQTAFSRQSLSSKQSDTGREKVSVPFSQRLLDRY